MMIAISFTVVSLLFMGVLGVALYHRFVNKMQDMTMQSAEQLKPDGDQSGGLPAQYAPDLGRNVLQRH